MATPSTVLAAPRHPRYETIDIWRGIACLAVVIYHSSLYALFDYDSFMTRRQVTGLAGWLLDIAGRGREGVTLFFVLSGYCIATTVDSSRRRSSPVARYFVRRFRRIYPPYWIALGLVSAEVLIASIAGWYWVFSQSLAHLNSIPAPAHLTAGQWLGNLTLTESWRRLVGGRELFLLGQAWTLCYEEQFYAVFGLILWLCPRRMFVGAALVSVLTAFTYFLAPPNSLNGTFLDGRWWLFALGIGVYYAVNYASRLEYWIGGIGLALAAGFVKGIPAPSTRASSSSAAFSQRDS